MNSESSTSLVLDPFFGPVLNGIWVPAPRYVLRRNRLLNYFKKARPGSVLEIGCGAGAFLRELTDLGFDCTAVENSAEARDLSRAFLTGGQRVHEQVQSEWNGSFDYLVACEVLEHVERDGETLVAWAKCLKEGGSAILSVPAHMSRWGISDERAGHFRRYGKAQLLASLEAAGLEPQIFECYGFPLSSFTRFLRNRFVHKPKTMEKAAPPELAAEWAARTNRSGIERGVEVRLFRLQASWSGRLLMRLACIVQRLFLATELGDCFFVVARKAPIPAQQAGRQVDRTRE